MSKVAYVSVTYLFTVEPELVGLEQDCTEKELYNAVENYMEAVTCYIGNVAEVYPNDVEISLSGF